MHVHTVLLLAFLGAATSAFAQASELDDPSEYLALPTATTPAADDDVSDLERGLLHVAGVFLGLVHPAFVGAGLSSMGWLAPNAYAWFSAGFAFALISRVVLVPLGVFAMGHAGGRRGDFAWTLLGGVIGGLIGGAMVGVAAAIDLEDIGDASPWYAASVAVSAVALITGSILAFELSTRPRHRDEAPLSIRIGPLGASGAF